jgi:lipoprotein-anchoring transpeptidase ErfK/SrfK
MSLAVGLALMSGVTVLLVRDALAVRYERDVSRMVFNDNTELLEELRRRVGLASDSLSQLLATRPPPTAYIVVSIEDHRLWYKRGDSILFTAPVTTGSGKVLERIGADARWKFETPRGRLVVESKELDPIWVPPDWHYVELAQARGLGIVRLNRRQRLRAADGSVITVSGSDVVRIKGATTTPLDAGEDRELVVDGNLVIPPFGTNQRKYQGVLGTRRLNLGEGYAIHGTNRPQLIGRSVSHGCIRLRNEDIERLYDMVEPGTAVYVY